MEYLRMLRSKERFTHQDMANFLNISKAFYWQIENKKRTLSYKMAVRIADIFHKKPDEIFYDEFKNKD
ncbi:MAG: helix-turn-helix transcriptional regulator [Bacilli bacterium]|nr:helix-turn-helix transcriptional regulator [Bacilli bacterium]MDD3304702.1 helix-turn-helix transcriptional regulator [Bacilli bacterium]MDD4053619.1 helix-turn-helix transcriptional regulator [Bacilli bacterium]MDD4411118.1 helix-turn-helix transcriptional regulator [Bacilli bacterium]